jgi:hypothetical protein
MAPIVRKERRVPAPYSDDMGLKPVQLRRQKTGRSNQHRVGAGSRVLSPSPVPYRRLPWRILRPRVRTFSDAAAILFRHSGLTAYLVAPPLLLFFAGISLGVRREV